MASGKRGAGLATGSTWGQTARSASGRPNPVPTSPDDRIAVSFARVNSLGIRLGTECRFGAHLGHIVIRADGFESLLSLCELRGVSRIAYVEPAGDRIARAAAACGLPDDHECPALRSLILQAGLITQVIAAAEHSGDRCQERPSRSSFRRRALREIKISLLGNGSGGIRRDQQRAHY